MHRLAPINWVAINSVILVFPFRKQLIVAHLIHVCISYSFSENSFTKMFVKVLRRRCPQFLNWWRWRLNKRLSEVSLKSL